MGVEAKGAIVTSHVEVEPMAPDTALAALELSLDFEDFPRVPEFGMAGRFGFRMYLSFSLRVARAT